MQNLKYLFILLFEYTRNKIEQNKIDTNDIINIYHVTIVVITKTILHSMILVAFSCI